jgi:hypothetical protein
MRLAVLVGLTFVLADPAVAQRLQSGFFTVGGRVYAASIAMAAGGPTTTESGGGLEAEVAYAFTKTVSVFLATGAAAIVADEGPGADTYGLGTADLGVKFSILPSSRLSPYVQAALTGQVAAFDVEGTSENLEFRGGGVTLGGGLLYSVSDRVVVDFSVDATGGRFTEVAFDGETPDDFEEIDTGIGRLGVGVVWSLY